MRWSRPWLRGAYKRDVSNGLRCQLCFLEASNHVP